MDAAPAASARPSFWRRWRATMLTVALVLYMLALGVGIADDVFHLGLFPTDLERRARRLIEQFDALDAATRQQAADRLVSDIDTFVAVPALLRAMDHASEQRRALAAETLRRITETSHGYRPDAPPDERRAAIQRWRAWWRENKYRY